MGLSKYSSGSMLGILYIFFGGMGFLIMGFLIFMKEGSFFLPRVMWAKCIIAGINYNPTYNWGNPYKTI